MFEDLSMLIRSAVDGNGVALVRHVVAMQEIASGQLVRLFDIATPCPDEYFFVSPPGAMASRRCWRSADWLLAEVAAFQRQQPGLIYITILTIGCADSSEYSASSCSRLMARTVTVRPV
jgi:hypothetical protein